MSQSRQPSLLDALTPILFLIGLLSLSVYLYGDNSSYGANQIALLLAAGLAAVIAVKNGYAWETIEAGIIKGISGSMGAILILLAVGSLIGTWLLAGTVPTMIYYGLQILSPSIFYFAACVICALVSVSIGSSWTTAGTVGIALIGMAEGLGLSTAIAAGAIISGAYFGDKMSPLSDTTNLAPAVTGTDLFTHIRHMVWTTVPSLSIALVLFLIIGLTQDANQTEVSLNSTLSFIEANYQVSWITLIPLVAVFIMAYRKVPAFPTIMVGALIGGLCAVLFQSEAVLTFVGESNNPVFLQYIDAVWRAMFDGYAIESDNQAMSDLLNRGGMVSMLNTVWLIICALTFGAVLEHTGLLAKLVETTLGLISSTGSLFIVTILTCIGVNVVTADQYIAIVLPGRMYKAEFNRRGLHSKNLSRTLEDSATMTSPLIPWNTCGAYMSGTLGVATMAYLPFCFFNLLSPIVSGIYGVMNIKVEYLEQSEQKA